MASSRDLLWRVVTPYWQRYTSLNHDIRKHVAVSGILTAVVIISSVVLATVCIIPKVNYRLPVEGHSTQQISIVTDYLSIDTTAGTLTADWYPLAVNCSFPEAIVNIYFDPNSLYGEDGRMLSDDPPSVPTFQFNTTKRCHVRVQDSFATFRTISKMVGSATTGRSGPSLQYYPFDKYFVQISLFAQMDSTNASVGIVAERPFGIPVNFNMKLNQHISNNTDQGLLIHLDITRSIAVRTLVIIIVLANWMITITFLWITVAAFIWPESIVKEFFVIPIATLFAFTSVRANMPGAPAGFGAFIDYIGILPNLALMTLCSAILLFVILIRRICAFRVPQDGSSILNALEMAEKAVAAANEALIVAKGALVVADSPVMVIGDRSMDRGTQTIITVPVGEMQIGGVMQVS